MRLALRLDPDPPFQEDAQARARVRVPVGDAARREIDAVAAHDPVPGRPLRQLPDERMAVDARRTAHGLVALDVVDDVVAGPEGDAVRVLREPQDQWKYWPPSITIVWPVTKSDAGPQR